MDPWSSFLAAGSTLGPTPGAREAWHRGRERYAVWLLRVTEPAIQTRRHGAAEALAPHGLVPLHDAHITVFVAGFPTHQPRFDDDVHLHVLEAQLAALRAHRWPLPKLSVGGVSAFRSCPFLEVHDPENTLTRLRAALGAHTTEPEAPDYVPHLTIGAFADSRPAAPIAAALAPFRELPPLAFQPASLELVTFEAGRSDGPLTTIWAVELG